MNPLTSVNFYITSECDSKCKFCFSNHGKKRLTRNNAIRVIDMLRKNGTQKITFGGGEPTLHESLPDFVNHANSIGMKTAIVTNGSKLNEVIQFCKPSWVALSLDSGCRATQILIGRGKANYISRTINLADKCRSLGIKLKVNTVVCSYNIKEDMTSIVKRIAPNRWKIFQVLPTNPSARPLEITKNQFSKFVKRNTIKDITIIPEDINAMCQSYILIDPLGRFYHSDIRWPHEYSQPILSVGVIKAFRQVSFDFNKLKERGGIYEW